MPIEENYRPGVPDELRVALQALPDPGLGKRLILFVRASEVRLRITEDTATIQEQETGSGEVGNRDPL